MMALVLLHLLVRRMLRDRRYPITSRFRDPGTELPAVDRTLVKGAAVAKGAADF